MVYYSHTFYRLLSRAFHVNFDEDVLIVVMNEGDAQKRVPYGEMTDMEARAALRYIGVRLRRLQEEFRKL